MFSISTIVSVDLPFVAASTASGGTIKVDVLSLNIIFAAATVLALAT